MVQVTQTDDEIKIIIELNRLITRKPDIVLLPCYVKFNNPPIFFERHLMHEIDELSSFCRIFKNEARLVLIKKQKGIWPEIFQKLSKEELYKKRLEIADQIVERNKERDKQAIERYEHKRRAEIDKEIRRETAMRERVKQFEENACREAMMVGIRKETHEKQKADPMRPVTCTAAHRSSSNGNINNNNGNNASIIGGIVGGRVGTPATTPRPLAAVAAVRNGGKINVSFSNFNFSTPKRESQEGLPRPFVIEDAVKLNTEQTSSLATVHE